MNTTTIQTDAIRALASRSPCAALPQTPATLATRPVERPRYSVHVVFSEDPCDRIKASYGVFIALN